VSNPGDYLYDGSGPIDPEVARLERLLRPLGRASDGPVPVFASPPRWGWRLALGAFLTVAAAAFFAHVGTVDAPPLDDAPRVLDDPVPPNAPAPVTGPRIRDASAGPDLAHGAWIETADADREILVGDVGRVRLAAHSRLQVRHVADDETRFYLAHGALEARVTADARPRFFQIDTDAARCVDLGCRYTLEVDADGAATVRVLTGQVAFETPTKEVFVPAGAGCVARKGRGPGTPRFDDGPASVAAAFDAFDASDATEAPRRRALALAALDTVRADRDTLPAWHLLQETDAAVVRATVAKLAAIAGPCDVDPRATAAELRAAWKAHLETRCW